MTWVALLEHRDPSAAAAAEADAGGWLCVWTQADRPHADALRADPAAFDADGPAACVSLVLVPAHRNVLFDDPVVQRARQRVLETPDAWTAVTTLVSDPVHYRGSLLAGDRWTDDPFAAIEPARRLRVGPGLLSAGPLRLPAPVIERYAGQPWPQAGFGR